MADRSLSAHERDVEIARAKLTRDLAVLCSPQTVAGFTEGLKQEALQTTDAAWEKLKARAAANPAAMMAIAAGLGWRFMNRPPIASGLIGLGLFSLWRTSAVPVDKNSTFLQQSARSLKTQAEELASATGDLAGQAKDAVADKGAETWDAAKATIQTKMKNWSETAAERLEEARAQARSTGDAVLDNLRRQQHDLRDQIAEAASTAKETLTDTARQSIRDEDTRNALLMGLAGVAVAAAVGIACQKRMAEPVDG